MPHDVANRVRRMVALNLGRTSVECTDAATLESLGCDSLDHVSLMIDAETEFCVEIPDADAEKIVTVGDLAEYVRRNAT